MHLPNADRPAGPSFLAIRSALAGGDPIGASVAQAHTGIETRCPAALAGADSAAVRPVIAVVPEPPPEQTRAVPVQPSVPLPSFEVDRSSFKSDGLEYGGAMASIFAGDFLAVAFDRESKELAFLLSSYLDAFGRGCPESLPPNKVEMTRDVCVREQYWVNGSPW